LADRGHTTIRQADDDQLEQA